MKYGIFFLFSFTFSFGASNFSLFTFNCGFSLIFCSVIFVSGILNFNKILNSEFEKRGWESQPPVFDREDDAYAKFDFLKDRIGVEVQFGHSSFIGIDLLKFQVASFSNLDTIDFGVYITTTAAFQKELKNKYGLKWGGSLTFEKVVRYLPYIRSAIQVPIYVIGIDV